MTRKILPEQFRLDHTLYGRLGEPPVLRSLENEEGSYNFGRVSTHWRNKDPRGWTWFGPEAVVVYLAYVDYDRGA